MFAGWGEISLSRKRTLVSGCGRYCDVAGIWSRAGVGGGGRAGRNDDAGASGVALARQRDEVALRAVAGLL